MTSARGTPGVQEHPCRIVRQTPRRCCGAVPVPCQSVIVVRCSQRRCPRLGWCSGRCTAGTDGSGGVAALRLVARLGRQGEPEGMSEVVGEQWADVAAGLGCSPSYQRPICSKIRLTERGDRRARTPTRWCSRLTAQRMSACWVLRDWMVQRQTCAKCREVSTRKEPTLPTTNHDSVRFHSEYIPPTPTSPQVISAPQSLRPP